MQRVELQRELGLHLRTTIAEVEDGHRFVDRDFPGHLACERHPFRLARPIVIRIGDLTKPLPPSCGPASGRFTYRTFTCSR